MWNRYRLTCNSHSKCLVYCTSWGCTNTNRIFGIKVYQVIWFRLKLSNLWFTWYNDSIVYYIQITTVSVSNSWTCKSLDFQYSIAIIIQYFYNFYTKIWFNTNASTNWNSWSSCNKNVLCYSSRSGRVTVHCLC